MGEEHDLQPIGRTLLTVVLYSLYVPETVLAAPFGWGVMTARTLTYLSGDRAPETITIITDSTDPAIRRRTVFDEAPPVLSLLRPPIP